MKSALQLGLNVIEVKFSSAITYAARQAASYPYDVPYVKYPGQFDNRQFIRKEQVFCLFLNFLFNLSFFFYVHLSMYQCISLFICLSVLVCVLLLEPIICILKFIC